MRIMLEMLTGRRQPNSTAFPGARRPSRRPETKKLFTCTCSTKRTGSCLRLLPSLQTFDEDNACLTCSVVVTDDTHNLAFGRGSSGKSRTDAERISPC